MESTDSDATQKSSDPYEEDQDIYEIGDDDLRPEWPAGGMVCPITGCGTTFYVNLTTYWGHWKRKHHGQLEQLHCPKCPHKSLNKKYFATHLNKKHKIKKSDLDKIIASVHKEFVPNKEFIPPGTQRCPKRKSENLETQRGAKRQRIKSPSQESRCKQDGNNLSLTTAETDVNVSICNVAKDVSSADEIKRLSSTRASETGQKDSNEGSNKNVSHGNGASRKANILHPDQSKNVTVCPPTEVQNISVSNAENEKEISNSSFIIQMEEKSEAAQLPDEGWHVGGMRCHVPACGFQHFDTLNSYQAHWKKVHSDTIKKFKCPLCSFKQSEKLQLQRHLRLKHNVDKTAIQGILSIVKAEVLPNLQFINPGTVQHPKGKQHDISGSEGKKKKPRLSAAQESEMKQTIGGQKHSTEQTDSGDPSVGGKSRSTQGIQSDNRQYTDGFSSQDKNILQVGLKVDTVAKLSNEDDVSNDTIEQDVAQLEREETETKVCVTKVQENAVEIKRKFADFDKGAIQRKKTVDTQVSNCVAEDGDDDESDYHESDPDLTVTDDSELDEVREAEDLDTVVRPIFLDGQMLCPGSGCLDQVYNSLKAFYEHWQTKHQVSVQRFECPSCSFKDIRKMEIRRHLKQDHNVRHRSVLEKLFSLVKLESKPKTGEESKPETSGKRKSTSQEKAKNKKQKLSFESDSDEKEDAKSGRDEKSKGNIRPAYVKGMCCPIKTCSSEKFDTYYRLEEHWKSKHEKYIKKYTCLKCSYEDARENNFWNHLRKEHLLAAECTERITEKAKINRKRILNTKFIDPGQYECPSRSAERKVSSSKEREGIYSMPEWVKSGMQCPVGECGDHHYTSHASFISHWKKKHTNLCMKFGCPECSIQYFDKTDLKCHLRHRHHYQGKRLEEMMSKIKSIIVDNRGFSDTRAQKGPRHHYQGKRLEEMMSKIKSIIVDNRGFSDTRAQKGPKIKDILLKEKSSKREKSKDKDKTKKEESTDIDMFDLTDMVVLDSMENEDANADVGGRSLEWLETGMQCPIQLCGPYEYISYAALMTHWRYKHARLHRYYQCPQCNFQDIKKKTMKNHLMKKHQLQEEKALMDALVNMKIVVKTNKYFIDPGNLHCPVRRKKLASIPKSDTKPYKAACPVKVKERVNEGNNAGNTVSDEYLKDDVIKEETQVEQQHSAEDDHTLVWVEGGMPCPVEACGGHIYSNPESLSHHWILTHLPYKTLLFCPHCSYKHNRMCDIRRHMRDMHGITGPELDSMTGNLKQLKMVNSGFIDPGNYRCPKRWKGQSTEEYEVVENPNNNSQGSTSLVTVTFKGDVSAIVRSDGSQKGNNAGNIVSDEYLKDDVIKEETQVEQQHSAEDDHTLVWVEGGMPCPVEACGGRIYSTHNKLSRHWILTHLPYKTFLFCPQCSCKQNKKSNIRRHMRDMHGITGPELDSKMWNLKNLKMMNCRYIDPGNCKCPKRWKGQSAEEYEEVENPNNNYQGSTSLVTVTFKGDVSAIVRSDGSQKGTDVVREMNEAEDTGTWADQESEEISKKLIPIKWVSGMSCPVMNCDASHFMSILSFWSHWDNIHQLHIFKFKCPMCTFINITKANIMAHLSAKHKMSDAKVKANVNRIKNVKVKNNRYIDPGFYYFSEMEEMKQFRADMTTTSPLEKKENDSKPVDQLHQEFKSACEKNKTSREFLEAEEKFDDKTSTSILTKDASLEGRPEARKVTVTQELGKSGTNETLEGLNKTKDKEPSEETNTEGETIIRVKWVQGMKCPVENCLTGNTIFFTLTSFHHHWEIRHYPCVHEFKCPRCGFQNLQRDRVGKHIKMLHGMVLHIQSVSVKNVNYIDPGQYYCPPLELFKAEAGPKGKYFPLEKKVQNVAVCGKMWSQNSTMGYVPHLLSMY